MRNQLLFAGGVIGEDPELLKTGRALADRWLDDPASLPADLVSTVLALAVRGNDKAFFEKLLGRLKAAPDRNQQSRLLRALGQLSDPALAPRALALVLGSELELRDSLWIVFSLLHGRSTRDVAYAFVKLHFDEIMARSSGFERPSLFKMPEVFCDAGAAPTPRPSSVRERRRSTAPRGCWQTPWRRSRSARRATRPLCRSWKRS